jgi:hypothetical protein
MNTRRNFFKFLGLAGGVAATGVAGAAALVAATPGKSEAVKQIEKIEAAGYNGKLTLGSEYGQFAPPDINSFTISGIGPRFVPGTKKQFTASMTVGPDGEMYLMTNGKWRRIVTE